ncbi:hypothetical protein PMAYCL1PPCAC_19052 [Pristionchus mayeri]|uniref:tRNA-dihydrouridine(47) synthase [NAD(P)(+)] n=1 Tax=Pristionchus mayeri TaxID=1317129 RepID=A0AAN5CQT8_9BILA|nr:hypothetical protein PMAYCL1PPCAC_19052 [Pristionchus mayeri]
MIEVATPEVPLVVERAEEPKANYAANVAPIKKEFLIEAPIQPEPPVVSEGNGEAAKEKKKEDRRDKRGMNKDRKRDMARTETKIRASAVRLCPSVNSSGDVKCKYGDKCTSEHDIPTFLAMKPSDIADKCPVYEANGKCRFSYACRFGNAHLGPNQEQLEKESQGTAGEVRNHHSMHIQVAMRKRAYDFSRSDEAVAEIQPGGSLHQGAMEWEKRKLDMKSLKGKKYLAPLTTVGNLPFRRLCVELGAEITCGEMAVATSLLMGTPSEWSLVKRHSSEKIFGVQMAGGYPDTMSKAAQILVDDFDVDFIDVNLGCPIDVVNQKGGGCALAARTSKLIDVLKSMRYVMKDVPLTIKLRTGLKENDLTADKTLRSVLERVPIDLVDFHPRSKEQRYTKVARWDFVERISQATEEVPLWVCGDVFSYEDYYERLEKNPIDGIVIGRGALIKPWIFTEIDEKRHWDITAGERIEMLQKFVNYGLDHWGSDDTGVEKTRRFLLELLSFQCRYIPVGLLERLPQRINDRPPFYTGRSEMETLLSSSRCSDWVEISKMFLGPPPDQFVFIPKHKASSY